MKHIISTIILLFAIDVSAQITKPEPPKEQTKIQSFFSKRGIMIIRDFYKAGDYDGKYNGHIVVEALIAYIPGESSKTKGLRITVAEHKDESVSFLDMDEAESLSKALGYLIDLATKWQQDIREYSESFFVTKDDFNIGFFQTFAGQTGFASSGRIGKKTCFFNSLSDLTPIKALVDEAIRLVKVKS